LAAATDTEKARIQRGKISLCMVGPSNVAMIAGVFGDLRDPRNRG
jgi:hypothetical protein